MTFEPIDRESEEEYGCQDDSDRIREETEEDNEENSYNAGDHMVSYVREENSSVD